MQADLKQKVLIVGAGMAGASAAVALVEAGFSVTLLEKSAGSGGRLSSRQVGPENRLQFDAGAQYFTESDARFVAFLQPFKANEVVQRWQPRLASIDQQGVVLKAAENSPTRWVSAPHQHRLVQAMLAGHDLRSHCQVARIARQTDGWRAFDATGALLASGDQLLLCLPAPQASALLGEHPDALAFTAQVPMQPCWAVLLSFAQALSLPWDAAFVNHGPLRWVARDSSKPGRDSRLDNWVLHATPEWSATHFGRSADDVVTLLQLEFQRLIGGELAPVYRMAKRWRYALGGRENAASHYYCPKSGLGVAGDWCLGGRVEGAFVSGLALAGQFIGANKARFAI